MKTLPILFCLVAMSGSASAADYQVEKGSTLNFSGSFQGEKFDGRFRDFQAQIRYDSTNIESSKFDVIVDLASVSTNDKDRDDALPGADFFDVGKFPNAHFVTRQFRKDGDKITAEGTLTMKGISKPVNLDVVFVSRDAGGTLDVTGKVQRLDFGIGAGEYADTATIGDEIQIKAHLELGAKL
jgi:polyisoprenoid-binding protein YceI